MTHERAHRPGTGVAAGDADEAGPGAPDRVSDDAASWLRSSATMAAGTIVSRVTGFLKVATIAAALGSGPLSDAYNTANNAPNSIYELVVGGVLSAVLVPLLVRADRRSTATGTAYAQRLLTLVVLVLLGLTVVSVAGAPLVIEAFAHQITGAQREVAIAFTRFFMPQVLFYGAGAVITAMLNARRRFAAPMWTPVLNNLTVIATGALFIAVVHGTPAPGTITAGETVLLGLGTTAGIVLQTVALAPSLLRAGVPLRPRFGFRELALGRIGRTGLWTVVYVATNLVGLAVVTNLANAAGRRGRLEGLDVFVGYTPYQNAFVVFSLPHAIVAVSVITALLPRMSGHAADRRWSLVRDDFAGGVRLAAALIVPAAAAMVALGGPIGVTIFGHGHYGTMDATYTGLVIAAFAVGLVPFSVFQLLLRVCYALQDTRLPALVNLAGTAVNVALALVFFLLLPTIAVTACLALAYGASYVVNTLLCGSLLSRRLGGLDGRAIAAALLRMGAAALPGAVAAYLVSVGLTRLLGEGFAGAVTSVVVGGVAAGGAFLLLAQVLHVDEVRNLTKAFRRRVGST